MARVVNSSRRSTIDPLKLSQPLGAALAFLGLERSIPLLHGSQGCSAFAKALLTKHFREPIPMQTTAVTELTAVLGATGNLLSALDTIAATWAPDVVGVITTGLTEAGGEDLDGAMRTYARRRAGRPGPLTVAVNAPDFVGGLSDGWAAALTAIVTAALALPGDAADPVSAPGAGGAGGAGGAAVDPDREVAVLAGVSLTAADLDELARLVTAFGLRPLLVPDLSRSLDGHLGAGWSPLTTGGTPVTALPRLARARSVHAVGVTAVPAAGTLAAATGAQVHPAAHLAGLGAVDAFVTELMRRSGIPAPDEVRRDRARLADTLLDAHLVLGGARVALALEPELLAGVADLLAGAGAVIVTAVAPTASPVLADVPCEEVVIGDLADLADRAGEAGAELVVGSSHARRAAAAIGAAHLRAGIPVDDRLGVARRAVAGYRGGAALLTDAANHLLEHHEQHERHERHERHEHRLSTVSPIPAEESLC